MGIEDEIRRARAGIPIQSVKTNPRFNLISMLYKRSFTDKEGTPLFYKLQRPDLTSLNEFENICFVPGPEFLCADPRIPQPDINMDDVEDVTPEVGAAYDLGPIEDDADEATYRCWMVDSQRKNNILMNRILQLVTGGCFGSSTSRATPVEHPEVQHRPGKEPAGTEASSEAVQRSRNRRTAGHSGSGESD
ncbi:hypothetical protein Bca4012_065909 [Brassica carinata]